MEYKTIMGKSKLEEFESVLDALDEIRYHYMISTPPAYAEWDVIFRYLLSNRIKLTEVINDDPDFDIEPPPPATEIVFKEQPSRFILVRLFERIFR